jgi:hypothetical protein
MLILCQAVRCDVSIAHPAHLSRPSPQSSSLGHQRLEVITVGAAGLKSIVEIGRILVEVTFQGEFEPRAEKGTKFIVV